MGFMDELRKLTQPYDDDDDDFFEGADPSFKTPPVQATTEVPTSQSVKFENAFGDTQPQAPMPRQRKPKEKHGIFTRPASAPVQAAEEPPEGSVFGNMGKPKQSRRERTVNFAGQDAQVILFSPKTFDEAGEIVTHIMQNRSVVMTLEGLPTDLARRLLDFISGIAFALQGKITPVSAKTYFVTPQNVDILAPQNTDQSDY